MVRYVRARAVTSETPACCSMSERKRSRAVEKWPRANSLWARSKALSAAASSREGWRGTCVGAGLAALRCVGAAFVWPLVAFAGADLRGGDFVAGFFLAGAVWRALPADCFAGGFAGLFFAVVRNRFGTEAVFAGAAFRTGAFSATRLGLGFADFAVSLRLLAEDFGEALCGAGREEVLFEPLMTGSLMRSTRFSQIASHEGSRRPPAA